MDGPKLSVETGTSSAPKSVNSAPSVVFQPQKLKEVVEIIDLMGNVALRVREDSSSDMGGAGTGGGKTQQKSGTSARDEAIAKAPPVEIMQKKLIVHLRQEIASIERQARRAAHSNDRGAAWLLTELYRKVRRMTSLMTEIIHASAEMIRRFYISVFIDQQPLVLPGDSSAQSG